MPGFARGTVFPVLRRQAVADPKVRIFPLRRLPPGSIPFIRCGNRNPLSRGAGRSVFRPSCTVRRPARNFRGGRGVRSVRNAGAPGPLHPRRRSRSRSRPPPVLPRPHCPWRLRCPHGAASRMSFWPSPKAIVSSGAMPYERQIASIPTLLLPPSGTTSMK